MKNALFLYALVVLSFYARAQQPVLKNFTTRNGLPGNEVYFLHADKKGYIWICTDAGLVKYNGNYFKNFNSSGGLPDNTIFEVKEDKAGRIWFRSFSGKIGYVLNDSVYVIAANAKIEEFITNGIVCSFAIADNGDLFLGKRNMDTLSFLKICEPYTEANASEIWKKSSISGIDIIILGENDFVFSDSRGKTQEATYPLNIYNYRHEPLIKSTRIPVDMTLFTRVYRNKDQVYLSANCLLRKLDLKNKTVSDRSFKEKVITTVALDSNLLLIGENHKGVYGFRQFNDSSVISSMLEGLTFTHAVKDYQGGYWYATLEAGIFYMPGKTISCFSPGAAANGAITQITGIGDSILLTGYANGDVVQSKIRKGRLLKNEKLFSGEKSKVGNANVFFPLNDSLLIISGSKATVSFNRFTKKIQTVFMNGKLPTTFRMMISCRDSLLALRIGEIAVYNKNRYGGLGHSYESEDRLTSVAWDSLSDKIYLGGLRGLYAFNFQKKVSKKDRLLECRVEDVKAVSGVVYIATRAIGVVIKREGRYDTINERKGLISNICSSLTVDGNKIWVCTNNGISRITFQKNTYSIYNYRLNDFMDVSHIHRVSILANKAWFFSGSKIYSFDTLAEPGLTKFYIRSITIDHKPVPVQSYLELEHGQSNITIGYEALFYDCSTMAYRYKINKNGDTWITTTETSVNFPLLAPGEYEFVVQAKNKRGDWIEADKKVALKINKSFWFKGWVILLEVLLAVLIVVLVLRYRYRKLLEEERSKNELKFRMYELEAKAVKAQMNPHFIFNSLNSIQQFILLGDTDNAYKYLSNFSRLVRKLLESNTSKSISLEEEVDILKRYLEMEALRFEEAFTYELVVDPDLSIIQTEIPHMLIQPFVENAIWHGLLHKEGAKHLWIRFSCLDKERLVCTVEDNGVGRPPGKTAVPAKEKKSLAIEFIKQRLDLLGRTKGMIYGFEITDNVDANGKASGTTVIIRIPILNK